MLPAATAPLGQTPSTPKTITRTFVQLPLDFAEAATREYEPAYASAVLSLGDPCTAHASFLAGLTALLHRYTQQEEISLDLLFGADGALVPLCSEITPDDPIGRFVTELGAALEGKLPVAANGGGPGTGAHPSNGFGNSGSPRVVTSANVAVTLTAHDFPSLAQAQLPATVSPSSVYDLQWFLPSTSQPSGFVLVYNAKLFRASSIERMLESFTQLLSGVHHLDTPIRNLPLLTPAQAHQLKVTWDSGYAEYAQLPVHRLFEKHAAERPNAIAASFKGRDMTYGELNERANRLAHHLIASGFRGPESKIAVCVSPSIDILVSIFAIFKSGCVYVPIDPTHPETLVATILDEVQPRLVLTQSKVRNVTGSGERFKQFLFDEDWGVIDALPASASQVPDVEVKIDDPSHHFYTSGTTGKPKGVFALHRNVAHYINVAQQKYGFCETDAFCSIARYTFSISYFELLIPTCSGARTYLLERDEVLDPQRLSQTLVHLTVLHSGPSLLGTLFRHLRSIAAPPSFTKLRHISSGGDIVPAHLIEEMKLVFPNADIFVIYGSTEINVMGTQYFCDRQHKITKSYVGKPFPGVKVRLIDKSGNLLPIGAVGEICFAGNGLVSGYLNRPELNAEKFFELDGHRYYHMGDMGRFDEDGEIEMLGRRDFQIQLRGIRIELGGIENTVREQGLAAQCAFVVKTLDETDVRLVAFVSAPRVKTIAEFRKELAKHLPDYMLPQGLVIVDALPVTRNGKLDRDALQKMPWQPTASEKHDAPRNATEAQIARVFAEALGVPEVGCEEDFFDLGGHSLLAVKVLQQLENDLGIQFPPAVMFEHKTVRSLAQHSQTSFNSEPKPILLNGNENGKPLFLVVGVHAYRAFAKALGGDYSVYGVYAGREFMLFEASAEGPSVPELARDYLEIIRRQQPHGPYRIAGLSFGGVIAFELAKQLGDLGEEVVFLGMFDTMLPEWTLGWRYRASQMRRFVGLSREERMVAIKRGLRSRVPWLRDLGPKGNLEDFVPVDVDDNLAPLARMRLTAYSNASIAYLKKLPWFEGTLTLVTAGRRLADDPMKSPTCGWQSYVRRIETTPVDADHEHMLEWDHAVQHAAKIFNEALSRVDANT